MNMKNKVISPGHAAALIKDGDTVAWTTASLSGFCEEVAIALQNRFIQTGSPRNLTLMHDCGAGNFDERGMNHLAYEGLVKRLISGHIGQAPLMGKLISENKLEAYLIPQGVMVHMWRQIAGKKPGVITKVGLGTYADPRLEGCKASPLCTEEVVQLIQLEGEEWLYYKNFPANVAVIRGTTADGNGNLSMEREGLVLEVLPMAQAVHNSGGIVIAQVEFLAQKGTLPAKSVRVPGILIDYVVVAKPENHMQTAGIYYDPAISGEVKAPLTNVEPLPFDEREIVARRAAMELTPHAIVNLGLGSASLVGAVAAEAGLSDLLTFTTELGTVGGVPCTPPNFAVSRNPEAIIAHEAQFDFYDGGGLDLAFLGFAQVDAKGNLNASKFGNKFAGPGGFVNISQSSKKVVFCGTFTAGPRLSIKDGKITVVNDGKYKKFVNKVDQVTFSGPYAYKRGCPVLYVTERAVFALEDGELTLIEIAPGIDLEKDILGAMEFKPRISPNLKLMPAGIFHEHWDDLRQIVEANSGASGEVEEDPAMDMVYQTPMRRSA
jgi:propionate CoA-transferase